MSGFGTTNVHVNAPLSNFALQYLQDQNHFVADKIAPVLPVAKESDKYYTFDRTNWRSNDEDVRAPGSPANVAVMPGLSTDTYIVEEHALRTSVPLREINGADTPLTPLQDATAFLTEKIMINKEKAIITEVLTSTGVGGVLTILAAVTWDGTITSQPINDFDTAIEGVLGQVGVKANNVTVGAQVWRVLKNHDDILDRIKYTEKGIIGTDLVASLLDVDAFNVCSAIHGVNQEGAALTITYLWNEDCLVNYVTRRPAPKTITHAYQFVNRGAGVRVRNWFDDSSEAQVVEASVMYDFKVVATAAGYKIENPLA